MSEPVRLHDVNPSADGSSQVGRIWSVIALVSGLSAWLAIFFIPTTPWASLGFVVVSLIASWRARAAGAAVPLWGVAVVIALSALGAHLAAGLAWSTASFVGQ